MVPRLQRPTVVRSLVLLACTSLLGGCPGESTSHDGGVEDGENSDDGLTILIDVDQELPATTSGGTIQVDSITIATSTIRALGDSAPGDESTTREGVDLVWTDSEGPESFRFERAPAGRYSSVKIHVVKADADEALRVRGAVDVSGTMTPFEIESELIDLTASIAVDEMLAAGGAAEIRIVLTVATLVDAIDWSNATDDGGTLLISDGNPELAKVEAALVGPAFRGD